jgi:hypothetical protein
MAPLSSRKRKEFPDRGDLPGSRYARQAAASEFRHVLDNVNAFDLVDAIGEIVVVVHPRDELREIDVVGAERRSAPVLCG